MCCFDRKYQTESFTISPSSFSSLQKYQHFLSERKSSFHSAVVISKFGKEDFVCSTEVLTFKLEGPKDSGFVFFPCLQNINFTFLNSFGASADGDILTVFGPKHPPIFPIAYVAFLVWPVWLHIFFPCCLVEFVKICKEQAHCYFRRNAFFFPLCRKISLHSSMVFTTLFNQSIIQNIKSLHSSFSNTLSVAQHHQDEKAVWIFNLCITTHLSPFYPFSSFELKPLLCVLLIKQ